MSTSRTTNCAPSTRSGSSVSRSSSCTTPSAPRTAHLTPEALAPRSSRTCRPSGTQGCGAGAGQAISGRFRGGCHSSPRCMGCPWSTSRATAHLRSRRTRRRRNRPLFVRTTASAIRELHPPVFLPAQAWSRTFAVRRVSPRSTTAAPAWARSSGSNESSRRERARRRRRTRQRRGSRHTSNAMSASTPSAAGTIQTGSTVIRPTSIEPERGAIRGFPQRRRQPSAGTLGSQPGRRAS